MRAAVLGGGHVGTACALALAANAHARAVTLLRGSAEDVAACMAAIDNNTSNNRNAQTPATMTRAGFALYKPHMLVKPAALQLDTYAHANAASFSDVFVATPVHALATAATTTTTTAHVDTARTSNDDGGDHTSAVVSFLRRWSPSLCARDADGNNNNSSTSLQQQEQQNDNNNKDEDKDACAAMCVVLTRGLSADGQTPVDLVQQHLAQVSRDASTCRRRAVLVASGPLFPREWALASAHTTTTAAAATAAATSSVSRDSDTEQTLRRYSGTALTFALATRELRDDAGLRRAIEQRLRQTLHRESVTFLHDRDAADVLSLLNACAPLCAFGAGLVSNSYASSSQHSSSVTVAALAAYAQHACSATQQLIHDVLSSPSRDQTPASSSSSSSSSCACDVPLPSCVWSTLLLACTNHASREFALGRQLNYHGRQRDAMRSMYGAPSRRASRASDEAAVWCELQVTTEGLHALLRRCGVSSPFYGVLMDAFDTTLRASVAGDGLVKEGDYDYRAHPPVTPLLRYMTQMDKATFEGNDADYAAAARDFEQFVTSQRDA